MRTIGEVAALAGVSIETLRHYDQLGLLKPRARSHAGYRLYGQEEFLRLREILIWRQLGFGLADVAALIDDPHHDRADALRRQLQLLRDQHQRFGAMRRGLEEAIAATEGGRSLVDDDVFRGFDVSLLTDDLEREAVTARLRLIDGPSHLPRRLEPTISRSRRIAALEPTRVAENLLALGIVPAGTGTFWDYISERPYRPWPDLVETPIWEQVQGLGWFGRHKDLIAKVRPDLIVDLSFPGSGQSCGGEEHSLEECRHKDLCEIAPTVLLEGVLDSPEFLGRIKQLATILSLEDRVVPLVASWEARTAVLREHVSGQAVSAFNAWAVLIKGQTIDPDVIAGCSPDLDHESQLFSTLGMELLPPPEGDPTRFGGAVRVKAGAVRQLTAPTLFLTISDGASPERFRHLLSSEPCAGLPAVKDGRAFDFRWYQMRSGWFSAHYQLDVIARAFGVWRLRTAGSAPPVHFAVADSGRLTLAPTAGAGCAKLSGPRMADVGFELAAGTVTDVHVGDAAAHLCSFPEAYQLITSDGACQLAHDRESALERVTQNHVA